MFYGGLEGQGEDDTDDRSIDEADIKIVYLILGCF